MLGTRSRRWGCRRVELKTDALNARSRGRWRRWARRFEGVHRKHMLVRGGENRDSAWYSIVDDDWPDVAERARRATPGLSAPPERLHCQRPVSARNWSHEMIDNAVVIGTRGRVGSAVSARLLERGVVLREDGADLVLLCVPDRAIATVAADDRARAPGSRTRAAERPSRPSGRTSGASRCIPCRRSRSTAGPSSSTARGPR